MANLKSIIDSIRKIMWQDTGLNGVAQRIEQLGWMFFLKVKPLTNYGSPLEIIKEFGSKAKYLQAIKELEQELYKTGS